MNVIHYVNLSNGIEALLSMAHPEQAHFLRIQSTACEQHHWDHLILDLDNDFLMNLALGNTCIVHDYSAHRITPRAIWQGLKFIHYCLYWTWLGKEYPCDPSFRPYFERCYQTLGSSTKNKLRYFKKFLCTEELHLYSITAPTAHDGDIEWQKEVLERCLPVSPDNQVLMSAS